MMASKRKRKVTDDDFSLLRGSFTPEQVRKIERIGTRKRRRKRAKAPKR